MDSEHAVLVSQLIAKGRACFLQTLIKSCGSFLLLALKAVFILRDGTDKSDKTTKATRASGGTGATPGVSLPRRTECILRT